MEALPPGGSGCGLIDTLLPGDALPSGGNGCGLMVTVSPGLVLRRIVNVRFLALAVVLVEGSPLIAAGSAVTCVVNASIVRIATKAAMREITRLIGRMIHPFMVFLHATALMVLQRQ